MMELSSRLYRCIQMVSENSLRYKPTGSSGIPEKTVSKSLADMFMG